MSEIKKPESKVILVAEDELVMGKIEKYYPGSGPGIIGSMKLDEIRKMHQEILTDFYEKGYMYNGFHILGANRRMYYIFSKFPDIDMKIELDE